jgi:hypothetical protein
MTSYRMVSALVALGLGMAAPVAAQVPLLPGQQVSLEVDPGRRQESPTSPNTIVRPEANVAFEYRIDGAATSVAAVKVAPCTPVSATSAILTCRLVPPTLSAGPHTLQVRSITSPAEPGIAPSDWSSPALSLSVIIVTPTGIPSNLRVTPQP